MGNEEWGMGIILNPLKDIRGFGDLKNGERRVPASYHPTATPKLDHPRDELECDRASSCRLACLDLTFCSKKFKTLKNF